MARSGQRQLRVGREERGSRGQEAEGNGERVDGGLGERLKLRSDGWLSVSTPSVECVVAVVVVVLRALGCLCLAKLRKQLTCVISLRYLIFLLLFVFSFCLSSYSHEKELIIIQL